MQIGLSLPIEGGNQVLGRDVFYRFRDHSNQGLLAGKSVISSQPVMCTMRLHTPLPRNRALLHCQSNYPVSMVCASLRTTIPLDCREQERLLLGQN